MRNPGFWNAVSPEGSASRFDFLKRTLVLVMLTGPVIGMVIASRWGWADAAGFMAGCAWGLANFSILGVLLVRMTARSGTRAAELAGWATLKGIVLIGGLTALAFLPVPLLAFTAGFTWPLGVVVLRGAGAMWWSRVQEREQSGRSVRTELTR